MLLCVVPDLASVAVLALLSTRQPARTSAFSEPRAIGNALLEPRALGYSRRWSQSKPPRDSLKNGALIGLGVGAATGLVLGAVGCGYAELLSESEDTSSCAGGALLGAVVFGAAGAGIGAGIDALFEQGPAPPGSRKGLRTGVRIHFRF